jgi:hypothetical protein
MKHRILRQAAVGLAGLGLLIPAGTARATDPISSSQAIPGFAAPLVSDVMLGPGGTFYGQVVDAAGLESPGVTVTLRSHDNVVGQAVSGPEGKFAVGGLRSGVFQATAGQGVSIYRLWSPEIAPPAAGTSALIVDEQAVVRGQSSGIGRFLTNPLVIAGIVAVAVAVPVVVHQIHIDHRSGS